MALAPWSNPPDFLRAMSAGASIGAQLRGQDIARGEAADRLSLAYNQLAQEEQQRNEAQQQRMQLAREGEAYKQQQLNMLQQWHQGQLAQQAAAASALDKYRTGELSQRQSSANALEKYRTGLLEQGQAKLDKPELHFGTQGEVLRENPDTGEIEQVRPPRVGSVRPSTFDSQAHSSLLAEEKSLQNSLATGGAFVTDDARLKILNRIGQIHKQRAALESKYSQPSAMPAGPTGTTSALGSGTKQPTRVKVKGPGGVSGTIPQGTTLPEGWSLAEEAAKAADQGMSDEEDATDEEQ